MNMKFSWGLWAPVLFFRVVSSAQERLAYLAKLATNVLFDLKCIFCCGLGWFMNWQTLLYSCSNLVRNISSEVDGEGQSRVMGLDQITKLFTALQLRIKWVIKWHQKEDLNLKFKRDMRCDFRFSLPFLQQATSRAAGFCPVVELA